MRQLKSRFLSFCLVFLTLLSAIGHVRALTATYVERPDHDALIGRSWGNSNNGTVSDAGVSLGVRAQKYHQDDPGTGFDGDFIWFNVSTNVNTRRGSSYNWGDYDVNSDSCKWMWDGTSTDPYSVRQYTNVANNSGFWVDLPVNFMFVYYGVKYLNWTGIPYASHVWISSNGFIAFDNSNSTITLPNDFPSLDAPNGVVAPFWTNLSFVQGQSEIDTWISRQYNKYYWFVVRWINMTETGTSNTCTFGLSFRIFSRNTDSIDPIPEDRRYLPSSDIWFFYNDLRTPLGYFGYGLEDQTGIKGVGGILQGSYAGQFNGTAYYYHSVYQYYVKSVQLTLSDSNPNGSFCIDDNRTFGRGFYTLPNPPNASSSDFYESLSPAIDLGLFVGDVAVGVVNWLSEGGIIGVEGITSFLNPVGAILLAAEGVKMCTDALVWWFAEHQYKPAQPHFDSDCVNVTAYDNYTQVADTVLDASLLTRFAWIVGNDYEYNHTLTITTTVEYGRWYDANFHETASTSVSVNLFPDDNNDSAHTQEVSYGSYGINPLLYVGGNPSYDQDDYYNMTVQVNDPTIVEVYPSSWLLVALYILNRTGQIIANSTVNVQGAKQGVLVMPSYTGTYTINVHGVGGSGFYNMTIRRDQPPCTPSQPLGLTSGYVYTPYNYTTHATDPDGDDVCYQFYYYPFDGLSDMTDPYTCGAYVTVTHSWLRPGSSLALMVRSQDCYGLGNGDWSDSLGISISQNDDGCLTDAKDNFTGATQYQAVYSTGTLYNMTPPHDTEDWYKFYAYAEELITIDMTPPPTSNFDLELYRPSNSQTPFLRSTNGTGLQELISATANEDGWWRARINYTGGADGQYTFHIAITGGGGGCPYVYAWNGTSFVKDNNILPASEIGNGTDTYDYYRLEQSLAPVFSNWNSSIYSLQIREFENEEDYIDQVRLLAVDHAQGTNIAVTCDGEILTYQDPTSPVSCVDSNGNNRLNEIGAMDGNIYDPSTFYQGYTGDYLIVDFGRVTTETANLILRDDQKCADVCILVQVPDGNGNWTTVGVLHPRDFWGMEAVNMTAYLPLDSDFVVRLFWTAMHRLDYVGLDTSEQTPITVNSSSPRLALHSTMGDVTARILYDDEDYSRLVTGERITLAFKLPRTTQNMVRNFILLTNGYYYVFVP